ncbi:hypothetical protein [Spiroplasma endosymbiont of Lonchoptera lutea]
MYKYLTIESIIAIKEYKSYGFSIRKIAKAGLATLFRTLFM